MRTAFGSKPERKLETKAAGQTLADDAFTAREHDVQSSVPLFLQANASPPAEPPTQGMGSPLPLNTRAHLEQAVGEDLGGVRLHTTGEAAVARGAKAVTIGNHVHFARSMSFESGKGREVLAHEIAHVVQQRRGAKGIPAASPGALEAEAHAVTPAVSAGRPAEIEGAAPPGAPQDLVTDEGDVLPDPILVDWSDRFQITFATRTTGFGDVLLQYKIKYLGSFAGQEYDTNFQFERDPGGVRTLGKPHGRRISAKLIEATSDSITVDVYGDGTVKHRLSHTISWNEKTRSEVHEFELLENGEFAGKTRLHSIHTQGVELRPESGVVGTVTPPNFTPDPDRAPQLPAGMLLDMVWGRLNDLKFAPITVSMVMLRMKIYEDMQAATRAGDDSGVSRNARALLDLLTYLGPVFANLDEMYKPEQYLGDLAPEAQAQVFGIAELYIDAMIEAYTTPSITKALAAADKAMAGFPDWLTFLYLRDDRGVKSLIDQIPTLQDELRTWQDKNDPHYYERLSEGPTRLKQLTRLAWGTSGSGSLAGMRKAQRDKIEWAWRDESDYVHELIQGLYYDVQIDIGLLTAMIAKEQLRYMARELGGSLINAGMEATFWGEREDKAWGYVSTLGDIVREFERASYVRGSKERDAIIAPAMKRLADLLGGDQFASDVDDFQTRLKWVDRISFVAKLAVIIAAAALTGGTAGSVAFAGLRAAGASVAVATAGELVVGGLVFTIVSREGQKLVFGQAEGNFFADWFWNTVTLGVLKAANFGFTKIFKLRLDPNIAKVRYHLGRTGTAMVSLHGVAEMHHLASTGEWMSGEERVNAIFQNVALVVALEAGRFITGPLEARLTKALVTKLRFDVKMAARIDAIAAERAPLVEKLQALSRGQSSPAEVEKLLLEIEALWAKELKLVNDGVSRKILSEGEMETALGAYRQHIAGMQLRLSQLGVEAPAPGGTTFRPVARGVIAYTPEGRQTLEKYYTPDPNDPATAGKSLKESSEMPGVLEGRLPNGELTYYIPEGAFPKGIADTQTIIAGRDAAVLAAKADPVAAEGLRRLQEGLKGAGANEKGLAQRNVDAILGSMAPDAVVTFLRAMADPAFTQGPGLAFYTGLAARPAAIEFARAYGPAAVIKIWRIYGWNDAMLLRAQTALETAETPAARKEFLDNLVKGDRAAVDKLLDNVKAKPAREPQASKKTLGVNRSGTEWQALRNDAEAFAKAHNANVPAEALDMMADLLQIHSKAMSGKFGKWRGNQEAIENLVDRFDELAFEVAKADPAGLQGPWAKTIGNWGRNLRGAIGEAVGRPEGVAKYRGAFLAGQPVKMGTPGATIPDYPQVVGGVVEWVNIKSDVLAPGAPGSRSGTYSEGVAAAGKYRQAAVTEAGNMPAGDKYSIQFLRDPLRADNADAGKRTVKAMLDTLFSDGSPIFRVKFGDRPWISRDEYVSGGGK